MGANMMNAGVEEEQQDSASDIIGVIKIKDGIFICDEFGAQVISTSYFIIIFS